MSEPVGNNPRGNIPGNSHKLRETEAPEPREKIEKIIEGKVVTRKQPVWKRVAHSMVADDVQHVGDFVVADVLVPAIKNLIYDIITQGSARTLFGTSRARRNGMGGGAGPVSSLKTAYNRVSENGESSRQLSKETQARHDFDMIVLDSRAEAVDVVESLIALVGRYNQASVSDLYDLVGVTGSFTDRRWGWTNLDDADVRQVRGGFLLDLPRPTELR